MNSSYLNSNLTGKRSPSVGMNDESGRMNQSTNNFDTPQTFNKSYRQQTGQNDRMNPRQAASEQAQNQFGTSHRQNMNQTLSFNRQPNFSRSGPSNSNNFGDRDTRIPGQNRPSSGYLGRNPQSQGYDKPRGFPRQEQNDFLEQETNEDNEVNNKEEFSEETTNASSYGQPSATKPTTGPYALNQKSGGNNYRIAANQQEVQGTGTGFQRPSNQVPKFNQKPGPIGKFAQSFNPRGDSNRAYNQAPYQEQEDGEEPLGESGWNKKPNQFQEDDEDTIKQTLDSEFGNRNPKSQTNLQKAGGVQSNLNTQQRAGAFNTSTSRPTVGNQQSSIFQIPGRSNQIKGNPSDYQKMGQDEEEFSIPKGPSYDPEEEGDDNLKIEETNSSKINTEKQPSKIQEIMNKYDPSRIQLSDDLPPRQQAITVKPKDPSTTLNDPNRYDKRIGGGYQRNQPDQDDEFDNNAGEDQQINEHQNQFAEEGEEEHDHFSQEGQPQQPTSARQTTILSNRSKPNRFNPPGNQQRAEMEEADDLIMDDQGGYQKPSQGFNRGRQNFGNQQFRQNGPGNQFQRRNPREQNFQNSYQQQRRPLNDPQDGEQDPEGSEQRVKLPPQTRDGDWLCNQCNNLNFAKRISCNNCGFPKSPEEILKTPISRLGPPGLFKEGDWQCFNCRNINFMKRGICNKCGEPKPQEYVERESELIAEQGPQIQRHNRYQPQMGEDEEGEGAQQQNQGKIRQNFRNQAHEGQEEGEVEEGEVDKNPDVDQNQQNPQNFGPNRRNFAPNTRNFGFNRNFNSGPRPHMGGPNQRFNPRGNQPMRGGFNNRGGFGQYQQQQRRPFQGNQFRGGRPPMNNQRSFGQNNYGQNNNMRRPFNPGQGNRFGNQNRTAGYDPEEVYPNQGRGQSRGYGQGGNGGGMKQDNESYSQGFNEDDNNHSNGGGPSQSFRPPVIRERSRSNSRSNDIKREIA